VLVLNTPYHRGRGKRARVAQGPQPPRHVRPAPFCHRFQCGERRLRSVPIVGPSGAPEPENFEMERHPRVEAPEARRAEGRGEQERDDKYQHASVHDDRLLRLVPTQSFDATPHVSCGEQHRAAHEHAPHERGPEPVCREEHPPRLPQHALRRDQARRSRGGHRGLGRGGRRGVRGAGLFRRASVALASHPRLGERHRQCTTSTHSFGRGYPEIKDLSLFLS